MALAGGDNKELRFQSATCGRKPLESFKQGGCDMIYIVKRDPGCS